MSDMTNNEYVAKPTPILVQMIKNIALLRESPVGLLGGAIVAFFFILAILAPVVAPHDPNLPILPFALPGTEGPNGEYFLFGTDHLGRDIFSRVVWGGQRVLYYATLATISAYLVGIIMGLLAGYYRGWVDELISFFANVILSFPVMVLYVLIITQIGSSGANIVFAVVFASSPGIMRIVRGLTLDLRTRDYVAAAQTRGESGLWIMLVEILPNARGPLIVDACLRMGYTTITIGALGFLGLGLPPPDPDWGGMITQTRSFAGAGFAHMTLVPALAVSLLVLGFNLLADGLREVSIRD